MLATMVAQITQHTDASARALRDDITTLHSNLESRIHAQSNYVDSAIANLHDDMLSYNSTVSTRIAEVEAANAAHAAHLRDLEEERIIARNELAWTQHQNSDLHARLAAIEERQERLFSASPPTTMRSIADAPPTAPTTIQSLARRGHVEKLSDTEDDVSALTSPPLPETSIPPPASNWRNIPNGGQPTYSVDVSTVPPAVTWRNNAHKSHCDPPVNFPTELLHKYDPTGFPEREFRHYCAGHLLPSDAARPSLAASTIRSLKRPAAIAITREYKGMILDTVTPVNLIRFWSARRDYARLGGDDPVAAAIGAQVCRHRRSA
jgi:hypothetical protein